MLKRRGCRRRHRSPRGKITRTRTALLRTPLSWLNRFGDRWRGLQFVPSMHYIRHVGRAVGAPFAPSHCGGSPACHGHVLHRCGCIATKATLWRVISLHHSVLATNSQGMTCTPDPAAEIPLGDRCCCLLLHTLMSTKHIAPPSSWETWSSALQLQTCSTPRGPGQHCRLHGHQRASHTVALRSATCSKQHAATSCSLYACSPTSMWAQPGRNPVAITTCMQPVGTGRAALAGRAPCCHPGRAACALHSMVNG